MEKRIAPRYGGNTVKNNLITLALLDVWKYKCSFCNSPIDWPGVCHLDHFIPRSLKNPENRDKLNRALDNLKLPRDFDLDSLENLSPMHAGCNERKSDNEYDDSIAAVHVFREIQKKATEAEDRFNYICNARKFSADLSRVISQDFSDSETLEELRRQGGAFVSILRTFAPELLEDGYDYHFGQNLISSFSSTSFGALPARASRLMFASDGRSRRVVEALGLIAGLETRDIIERIDGEICACVQDQFNFDLDLFKNLSASGPNADVENCEYSSKVCFVTVCDFDYILSNELFVARGECQVDAEVSWPVLEEGGGQVARYELDVDAVIVQFEIEINSRGEICNSNLFPAGETI